MASADSTILSSAATSAAGIPSSGADNLSLTIVDGSRMPPATQPPGDGFVRTGGLEDPFQDSNTSSVVHITPNPGYGQGEGARAELDLTSTSGQVFAPRADRLGQPITPQNAQGLFPPAAALFVANLSHHRSDDQLEVSVHSAFDTFGKCHVKIRRDRNQHPYAFVQFEDVDDANLALEAAKEVTIDGRVARTEKARAPCVVAVSRHDGVQVIEEEARELLQPYGPLVKCYQITEENAGGLHEAIGGMWAQFAYFSDCRDAVRQFDHTGNYCLQIPSRRSKRGYYAKTAPTARESGNQTYDEPAIFVGNLPNFDEAEGLKAELWHNFSRFGNIVHIDFHRKRHSTSAWELPFWNTFAFITYDCKEAADAAVHGAGRIDERSSVVLRNHVLRVEKKFLNPGRRPAPVVYEASPQQFPLTPRSHSYALKSLYDYAIELGLTQYQAASILSIPPHPPGPFYPAPDSYPHVYGTPNTPQYVGELGGEGFMMATPTPHGGIPFF